MIVLLWVCFKRFRGSTIRPPENNVICIYFLTLRARSSSHTLLNSDVEYPSVERVNDIKCILIIPMKTNLFMNKLLRLSNPKHRLPSFFKFRHVDQWNWNTDLLDVITETFFSTFRLILFCALHPCVLQCVSNQTRTNSNICLTNCGLSNYFSIFHKNPHAIQPEYW